MKLKFHEMESRVQVPQLCLFVFYFSQHCKNFVTFSLFANEYCTQLKYNVQYITIVFVYILIQMQIKLFSTIKLLTEDRTALVGSM